MPSKSFLRIARSRYSHCPLPMLGVVAGEDTRRARDSGYSLYLDDKAQDPFPSENKFGRAIFESNVNPG